MASGNHREEEYFPVKLFRMVEDKAYSEIIWWNEDGDGFFICEDQEEFLTSKILENYNFKTNSYGSFIRQLNNYGFHKKRRPNQEKANEPSSYYSHDKGYFKRSCSDFLMNITKTKGNQGTKKETSSKKETGQKLNEQVTNQDLLQSIKKTETDSSFENVTSGSFPGIHVGMSEVFPFVKEGTSVSSQTQAWCSTPSVIAATTKNSFPLTENMSATPTIPKRETIQDFIVNTGATSAVSRVGQSSVFRVGQMQSFGDTNPTQTIDILDIVTEGGHYMLDELMYDVGADATIEKTIPQTETSLISDVKFPENILLASVTTTLAPSVGGFDTSPFQSSGVPVPFLQQVSKGSSLPESLHEPETCEQHLIDQYPLQDQDFPPVFTTELQNKVVVTTCQGSEMSETGYSSEESLNQPKELGQEIAVATVTQDPFRLYQADGNVYSSDEGSSSKEQEFNVTINPESCRPEGGKCFWLEFDKSLPSSVTSAWAAFGPYGRVKIRTYDEDCTMFGKKIPPGRPGLVTVTVTTESGECLGETVFTYKNPKKKRNNQGLSNKRKVDELSAIVKDFAKKLKQFQQGDDGEESLKSAFQQGPLDQEKQLDPDRILKPLVYAAAEAGAMGLIETIFSLPAGRVVFEAYKGDSSLPEDIAEENGYGKVAAYLRDITKRYSEEQSTSPDQSTIDWLELTNAFEELELNQSVIEPSSDKEFNQIGEDDITETGYSADGETLSSDSEKGISDSDDGLNKIGTCKGYSIDEKVQWMGQEGRDETAGILPESLRSIGLKNVADGLICPSRDSIQSLSDQLVLALENERKAREEVEKLREEMRAERESVQAARLIQRQKREVKIKRQMDTFSHSQEAVNQRIDSLVTSLSHLSKIQVEIEGRKLELDTNDGISEQVVQLKKALDESGRQLEKTHRNTLEMYVQEVEDLKAECSRGDFLAKARTQEAEALKAQMSDLKKRYEDGIKAQVNYISQLQAKFNDLQRYAVTTEEKYFFSLVIGVKLNMAVCGYRVGRMNHLKPEKLLERVRNHGISIEHWPSWLSRELSTGSATPEHEDEDDIKLS